MAFTVLTAARLSDCKYVEAAGFTSCCGPRAGSLQRGFRHPARATTISHRAWGLLLGAPGLTEAGLAPAGDEQREADRHASASSRRTSGAFYAYAVNASTVVHENTSRTRTFTFCRTSAALSVVKSSGLATRSGAKPSEL